MIGYRLETKKRFHLLAGKSNCTLLDDTGKRCESLKPHLFLISTVLFSCKSGDRSWK